MDILLARHLYCKILKEYVTMRSQWEYFSVFPIHLALCYNVIIYSNFLCYPSRLNAWIYYSLRMTFLWVEVDYYGLSVPTLVVYQLCFSPKDEFVLPTYWTPWSCYMLAFFWNEVILCIPFLWQIVQIWAEIISSLLLPPLCPFI